jgi:hypothetical protein
MSSITARQKHDIVFIEPKGDTKLGCIDSFSDSNGIKITTILVKALEKRELFESRPVVRNFLLAFKPEKPENGKLVGFHQHLESANHKVAKIAFDHVQSKGYMYPVIDEKIHRLGYKRLFLVKVYEDNQIIPPSPSSTVQKSSSPQFNPNDNFEVPPPPPPKSTEYFPQIDLSIYGIAPSNPSQASVPKPPQYANAFRLSNQNKPSAPPPYSSTSQVSSSLNFGANSMLKSLNTSAPSAPTMNNVQETAKDPASFYQSLERKLDSRHETQILHLRNFNNFIKTELISHVSKLVQAKDGLNVLDLACGKGGDIAKWLKTAAGKANSLLLLVIIPIIFSSIFLGLQRYVGVDIAEQSIKDYVERLTDRNDRFKFEKLIVADLNFQSLTSSTLITHEWANIGKLDYYLV